MSDKNPVFSGSAAIHALPARVNIGFYDSQSPTFSSSQSDAARETSEFVALPNGARLVRFSALAMGVASATIIAANQTFSTSEKQSSIKRGMPVIPRAKFKLTEDHNRAISCLP